MASRLRVTQKLRMSGVDGLSPRKFASLTSVGADRAVLFGGCDELYTAYKYRTGDKAICTCWI